MSWPCLRQAERAEEDREHDSGPDRAVAFAALLAAQVDARVPDLDVVQPDVHLARLAHHPLLLDRRDLALAAIAVRLRTTPPGRSDIVIEGDRELVALGVRARRERVVEAHAQLGAFGNADRAGRGVPSGAAAAGLWRARPGRRRPWPARSAKQGRAPPAAARAGNDHHQVVPPGRASLAALGSCGPYGGRAARVCDGERIVAVVDRPGGKGGSAARPPQGRAAARSATRCSADP